MRKKAQISIEYLLLLSTIIAMLIIVILLVNRFVYSSEPQFSISEDKINCTVGGGKEITVNIGGTDFPQYFHVKAELKEYFEPYDGTLDTIPRKITFGEKEYVYEDRKSVV